MFPQESFPRSRSLLWAIAFSLALHGALLFLVHLSPPPATQSGARLEASLGKKVSPELELTPQPSQPSAAPKRASPPRSARPRVLTVEKPKAPGASQPTSQWSVAQRKEMNHFLEELADEPRNRADLAQRSLAMARDFGRREGQQGGESTVTLERLPDSPPVDPFSLEMYVDGLVKKLNRSAAFVKNDPRTRGLRAAAVQIRLNPNGSLRAFEILNAADQLGEVDFVRRVVEQAVPFAPFPADMRKSAQSLAMTICILPSGAGGGGFGFSRTSGGQGC